MARLLKQDPLLSDEFVARIKEKQEKERGMSWYEQKAEIARPAIRCYLGYSRSLCGYHHRELLQL